MNDLGDCRRCELARRKTRRRFASSSLLLAAAPFFLRAGFRRALCNEEILDLGAAFERFPQPNRLRAAAGPLVSMLVAILWRNLSSHQGRFLSPVAGDPRNMDKIVAKKGKLLL